MSGNLASVRVNDQFHRKEEKQNTMTMKHFSKFAAAAALSLVAVAAHATDYGFASVPNANSVVNVAKFDSLGGTLILDTITVSMLNVNVHVTASAQLNNPNSEATVQASTGGNVRLRNLANTQNMVNFGVDGVVKNDTIDTLPGGNPDTTNFGGPWDTPAGIDTDADGFADVLIGTVFVNSAAGGGTGSTAANRAAIWSALSSANTNFTIQNAVATGLSGTLTGGGEASITQVIGNTINGTLRVNYTFHLAPPEAPEPTSLAFAGMSVLGFVASRRRRK